MQWRARRGSNVLRSSSGHCHQKLKSLGGSFPAIQLTCLRRWATSESGRVVCRIVSIRFDLVLAKALPIIRFARNRHLSSPKTRKKPACIFVVQLHSLLCRDYDDSMALPRPFQVSLVQAPDIPKEDDCTMGACIEGPAWTAFISSFWPLPYSTSSLSASRACSSSSDQCLKSEASWCTCILGQG